MEKRFYWFLRSQLMRGGQKSYTKIIFWMQSHDIQWISSRFVSFNLPLSPHNCVLKLSSGAINRGNLNIFNLLMCGNWCYFNWSLFVSNILCVREHLNRLIFERNASLNDAIEFLLKNKWLWANFRLHPFLCKFSPLRRFTEQRRIMIRETKDLHLNDSRACTK